MPGESTSPSASMVSLPLSLTVADGDDPAVLDRDVGALGVVAQAVDDGGAADDEIDHQSLRPFFSAP